MARKRETKAKKREKQPAAANAVFVDEAELARRLPIERSTWQQWRARSDSGESGETGPPYFKVGRRVIYRWSEVEAWVAQRKVG